MLFNQSTKKIVGIVTVCILGGLIVVGFSIAMYPPTSNIPEPVLEYTGLNELFGYYNDTQGGAITNFLEFDLVFDNFQNGSAFLRLSRAIITVWIADITTHQTNASLMRYAPFSSVVTCNPSRDENQLGFSENNNTDGEWSATGTCTVILGTNELFPNNVIIVDYGFMMGNDIAKELDGHQFLIKVQADIIYDALYLGGLIRWQYQSATFEYILGNEFPIYMSPADT